ncbi:MAG: hypothetical protein HY777_01455 [Betaproteobacteria bacterium]|nr:hypothetical protein [Betaproteobacteria bacterium]
MEQFPIAAPEFTGDCRTVPAGNAFEWLKQGWAIFMVNPAIWIAMTVIFFVIFLGLSIVPLVGQLAANLLTPVFAAGLLLACKKAANSEALKIPDLFAGFNQNNTNLVMLGVIYMTCMLAILTVGAVLGGGSLAGGMMMGHSAGAGMALGGMLVAMLLTVALSVPLVMAMWFAPALVAFNDMQPVPALKASFNACLKNMMAFLVYGLITLVLCFFAALPLGLGFLVLVPVLAGTLYASYRDIFVAA